jgi:hypothetical protein
MQVTISYFFNLSKSAKKPTVRNLIRQGFGEDPAGPLSRVRKHLVFSVSGPRGKKKPTQVGFILALQNLVLSDCGCLSFFEMPIDDNLLSYAEK